MHFLLGGSRTRTLRITAWLRPGYFVRLLIHLDSCSTQTRRLPVSLPTSRTKSILPVQGSGPGRSGPQTLEEGAGHTQKPFQHLGIRGLAGAGPASKRHHRPGVDSPGESLSYHRWEEGPFEHSLQTVLDHPSSSHKISGPDRWNVKKGPEGGSLTQGSPSRCHGHAHTSSC